MRLLALLAVHQPHIAQTLRLSLPVPDQLKNVQSIAKCLECLVQAALLKVDVADIAQLRGLALAVARLGEDVQGVLKGGERLVDFALAEVDVADVVELSRSLGVEIEFAVQR